MVTTNPFVQTMEAMKNESNKALRNLFSKSIKGSFLIKIKERVMRAIAPSVLKYFDLNFSTEKLVSGTGDATTIDYEICRYIVGEHRSNSVFLTEEERVANERSEVYCDKLVKNVIEKIKLRRYAGMFFRRYPVTQGENFLFFSVPYDLFAIGVRMNEILHKGIADELNSIFSKIANKGLAALTMLEDNFFDSAYPICRVTMELYIKMLVLLHEPQVTCNFFRFENFEIIQSCCDQTYPNEFNELYKKRTLKQRGDKLNYLHFGWVDEITDYHSITKEKAYSLNGLISFLRTKYEETDEQFFDSFESLYKMCHGYAHGSVGCMRYPIMHYFEISTMLYFVLSHTYNILCERLNVTNKIDDVDIVTKINIDFKQFDKQYSMANDEALKCYYE